MKSKIYLDNNATTPLDLCVKVAIQKELEMPVGNPSSIHAFGQAARARLVHYRRVVANYLGVKPHELIFTSGGTEAINMVMRGIFGKKVTGQLITSNVEHACVQTVATELEEQGVEVTYLLAGLKGAVDKEQVEAAITSRTRLIVLMAVNNETGVKTDIEEIAKVALDHDIPFLVDGVALIGKESFTIPDGVSAMCFSGHKFHAPAGIGVCFIRNRLKLRPLILGGAQEYEKRGGTENMLGIAGLAKAIEMLSEGVDKRSSEMKRLRDRLEDGLLKSVSNCQVNGEGERVVNTTNISFKGVDGESLLALLDQEGIAASHGSACSAGALEPSRVLLKMGISPEDAASSVRFSLSRFTTEEEIDEAIAIITRVVKEMRRAT